MRHGSGTCGGADGMKGAVQFEPEALVKYLADSFASPGAGLTESSFYGTTRKLSVTLYLLANDGVEDANFLPVLLV